MSFVYVSLGMVLYLVTILREENFGATCVSVRWVQPFSLLTVYQ
jgi:hypothetical protein